jgi:hypothetical protein
MRSLLLVGVLAVVAIVGCSSKEASPQPAADARAERLREIEKSAKGSLTPLVRYVVWTGDRIAVTGLRNGLPTTTSIGPWRIELHPDPKQNVVELKGFLFAKNLPVRLDLDADLLTIDGEPFQGRKLSGKSPLYEMTPFEGVVFERADGKAYGKASILILADGRVSMDFDKVVVNNKRAHEYGALSGANP